MSQQALQKAGLDSTLLWCNASDKRPLVEANEPDVRFPDGSFALEKIVEFLR
jgi:hypothetical protein